MRLEHFVRTAVISTWLAVSGTAIANTSFGFSSSPESFIGQGETVSLVSGDGYQMGAFLEFNNTIHFYAIGYNSPYNPWRSLLPSDFAPSLTDPSTWWEVAIGIGNGQLPHVGGFVDPATSPDFSDPFVSFIGNYRASNQASGSFTIDELTFDSSGAITSLTLNFVHFGENNPNSRDEGYVRFNSSVPVPAVPEPSAYVLLIAGLAVVVGARRRRSKAGAVPPNLSFKRTANGLRPSPAA